jgi:hypothetical protein
MVAPVVCIALLATGSYFKDANAVEPTAFGYAPSGAGGFSNALTPEQLATEALLNTAPDTGSRTPVLDKERAQKPILGKALKAGYASVFGSIVNNYGTPVCGLVLANGSFMFSCAPNGSYSLNVPLDSNNQITLFGFADGHFPYKSFNSGGRQDIVLQYANPVIIDHPTSTITFQITDGCNDGYSIDYKFYDETNNLVWPSSSTYYYTSYYNTAYTNSLSCNTGAKVCYGGNTGTLYWGVGVDNTQSCADCCISCQEGNALSRTLTCS